MNWTEKDTQRVVKTAKVTDTNIHIPDSYAVPKKVFNDVLNGIKEAHPDAQVCKERGNGGMRREWATHNLCYALHIFLSHTADVDLNYPQKWYEKLIYGIVGTIALIFIK